MTTQLIDVAKRKRSRRYLGQDPCSRMSDNSPDEWPDALSVKEIRRLGRALPKRLKFTRDGKFVVFVTLGLKLAAINSGNNLLYLIFGMMLGLIVVSGVLSGESPLYPGPTAGGDAFLSDSRCSSKWV